MKAEEREAAKLVLSQCHTEATVNDIITAKPWEDGAARKNRALNIVREISRQAQREAYERALTAVMRTTLPSNYIWSQDNRDKFKFGVDESAAAVRALMEKEAG